jgi:hypothetical protein
MNEIADEMLKRFIELDNKPMPLTSIEMREHYELKYNSKLFKGELCARTPAIATGQRHPHRSIAGSKGRRGETV